MPDINDYYAIVPDKRFEDEATLMSQKLVRLFYDRQIILCEWRKAYKHFVHADRRKANLTPGVLQKSRDKADRDFNTSKEQLLRLQDQRDLFEELIQRIWDRCGQIKWSIKNEQDLETLRQDLNERVKEKFPADHAFWSTNFSVRLPGMGPTVEKSGHRQKNK